MRYLVLVGLFASGTCVLSGNYSGPCQLQSGNFAAANIMFEPTLVNWGDCGPPGTTSYEAYYLDDLAGHLGFGYAVPCQGPPGPSNNGSYVEPSHYIGYGDIPGGTGPGWAGHLDAQLDYTTHFLSGTVYVNDNVYCTFNSLKQL